MPASAEFQLEQIQDILNRQLGKDMGWRLAREGRIFTASSTSVDAVVTGQTAFANTTPTFFLRVPAGVTIVAIPLAFTLNQAGTVAGSKLGVLYEHDDADVYSSGGSELTPKASRIKFPVDGGPQCKFYVNPTLSAGYGQRQAGWGVAADVEPAEAAIQEILWTPISGIDMLDAESCAKLFTYSTSGPGPSWWWTYKWAEMPLAYLDLI